MAVNGKMSEGDMHYRRNIRILLTWGGPQLRAHLSYWFRKNC
jgi:hypothetical protein